MTTTGIALEEDGRAASRLDEEWKARSLLMAWVLTLPVSIVLSGALFWLFTKLGS